MSWVGRFLVPLVLGTALVGVSLAQYPDDWVIVDDAIVEQAVDPLSPPPIPAGGGPLEVACRAFPVNLEDGQGGYFETSDRTGPVGEWMAPLEEAGWQFHDLDFELGQRGTGFPYAEVMICVSRPRG